MGAFVVSLHVRTEDRQGLVREARTLAEGGCWVAAPKDGWAAVYEERASGQDDGWIRQFGAQISDRLDAPAVAFLVHDSDFFCYWLFEHGELVDEFNSCPDYFDGDGDDPAAPQARPDVLLRFCKPGSRLRDVRRVLSGDSVFAEEQLQELAGLLGIDPERVLTDYRDLDETAAEALQAEFVGTGRPQTPKARGGRAILKFPDGGAAGAGGVTDRITRMMGFAGAQTTPDPGVAQLVQAAADGDVAEVERLVAAGANLEGEGPIKPPTIGPSSFGAQMLAGGLTFPVTPLLAAVAYKQVDAARRLIELGANVHARHRLFGSALHGAVTAGSPELVRLLLDAGAEVNERNAQGQTPFGALQALRAMLGQLGSFPALGGPMGRRIEAELGRLTPTAGWDECERLLRDRGGR